MKYVQKNQQRGQNSGCCGSRLNFNWNPLPTYLAQDVGSFYHKFLFTIFLFTSGYLRSRLIGKMNPFFVVFLPDQTINHVSWNMLPHAVTRGFKVWLEVTGWELLYNFVGFPYQLNQKSQTTCATLQEGHTVANAFVFRISLACEVWVKNYSKLKMSVCPYTSFILVVLFYRTSKQFFIYKHKYKLCPE